MNRFIDEQKLSNRERHLSASKTMYTFYGITCLVVVIIAIIKYSMQGYDWLISLMTFGLHTIGMSTPFGLYFSIRSLIAREGKSMLAVLHTVGYLTLFCCFVSLKNTLG